MRKVASVREVFLLILVAAAAIFIHGYHLGTDDAEIYVPAIKKAADPTLFPFGSEFFMHHASLSFFPDLIGFLASLTRISIDWVIFLCYVACVFLLVAASRQLVCACFRNERARWAGVVLLAAVMTVPVAGTALLMVDPYVTARSLSTPATLFAIACFATNKRWQGLLWLLITALIHPQMGAYCAAFAGTIELVRRCGPLLRSKTVSASLVMTLLLPMSFEWGPAQGPYREILFSRSYFLVSTWRWWEWIGVFAPLALLWFSSTTRLEGTFPVFRVLTRSLVFFGLSFTAAGIVLASSDRLQNFARLQPMRSFHLIYILFFLFLGGMIGEYLLKKNKTWRRCSLFLLLGTGMWMVQEKTYPSSPHIEWPGSRYQSGWVSAFLWVRQHTPRNAVFALNPGYMLLPGVDLHGFRAIAERSALADNVKDGGAVSVFPQLAAVWKLQTSAEEGWTHFKRRDFETLAERYGVRWVILRKTHRVSGLSCPYQNDEVMVCHIGFEPQP